MNFQDMIDGFIKNETRERVEKFKYNLNLVIPDSMHYSFGLQPLSLTKEQEAKVYEQIHMNVSLEVVARLKKLISG